ncbi:LysM peptidoglycan-binding domain-containing protein [Ornithinimicrobium cryptoxanthini]|uniref:LysM peptidoglycan-binding domain-containing protein n=1 Tax=Ornithinimicrobium cryptoxanthini TaxID=2934161 RepID=UPI0021191637|nr:LysM peptidoglycan-binding domain-containing protein [Ornithinimicrobium cryptoxanthini]
MSPVADLPPALHVEIPVIDLSNHQPVGTLATAKTAWSDYRVQPGDTLYDLAIEHGTTVSALATRNSIKGFIHPGQVIEVPGKASGKSDKASSRGSSKASSGKASSGGGSVTVRSGDTLSAISLTHDVSVGSIMRANNLSSAMIHPGQQLTIPGGKASGDAAPAKASAKGTSTPAKASAKVTVRPGDTLSHISARHNVSVSAIIRANNLPSAMIYPGQQLSIPGAKADTPSKDSSAGSGKSDSAASTHSGGTVTVRAGDTLSGIAAANGISLTALVNANPGVNARGLQVGQQITLPGATAAASRSSAYRDGEGAKKGAPNSFLHYTYSDEVAGSAAANRDYLSGVPVPTRDEVNKMVRDTAKRHGVDPDLMLGLSYTESGWNHRSVSPANAIGVMQVIPASGDWASGLVGRELNLLDPQDNVTAGTVIMRALLRSADNEDQAIGGYYQGLYGVQTHGMYADTKNYVKTVKHHRDRM